MLKTAKTDAGLKSDLGDTDFVSSQDYTVTGTTYAKHDIVLNERGEELGEAYTLTNRDRNCWGATKKLIEDKTTFDSGSSTSVYQLGLEDNSNKEIVYNQTQTKNAIKVIIDHLEDARPIQVGVSYRWNYTKNYDKSTDHFVTIRKMKFDSGEGEFYFEYVENGTHWQDNGTNENNRIYIKKDASGNYTLEGNQTVPGGGNNSDYFNYKVTQVRPNGDYIGATDTIDQTDTNHFGSGNCGTDICLNNENNNEKTTAINIYVGNRGSI